MLQHWCPPLVLAKNGPALGARPQKSEVGAAFFVVGHQGSDKVGLVQHLWSFGFNRQVPTIRTNMLKFGKQSPLKQEWKRFLKSSSLFVRILVSKIVLTTCVDWTPPRWVH